MSGVNFILPYLQGGLQIYRNLDLDETPKSVAARRGQLYGGWVWNAAAATLYLKFYNALVANVSVGTTTPVLTLPIPANATTPGILAFPGAGSLGIEFQTGITVACVTGAADNSTGAPGSNEMIVNLFYCDRIT